VKEPSEAPATLRGARNPPVAREQDARWGEYPRRDIWSGTRVSGEAFNARPERAVSAPVDRRRRRRRAALP
jgi:hypothetical protein